MSELDPVLRCDSCNTLVTVERIHKLGICPDCGNKRFREVLNLKEDEREKVMGWGFDSFLEEFEVVE